MAEDASGLDPEIVAPLDDGTDDLAPITMTWAAVSPRLRALPVDASFLVEDIAWSPVFTPQSFRAGRKEPDRSWGPGSDVAWLGGPAVPPLDAWPRRTDGVPLAHVMSVSLVALEWDEDARRAWADHRGGLPEDGVLEVFHDLETYGTEPGDRDLGAWLVRWVPEPDTTGLVDPPADLDTPSDACQAGMFLPGWSTRSPLEVEGWTTLDGWFGDGGMLEVWMRASDLEQRRFDRAWCLVRQG